MRRRFTLAIALLLAAVGLSAGAQTPSSTAQWIESKSANYTVYYQPGYEKDAAFARTWMDRAEELLKSKYGVPYRGFHVAVYLEPAPTAQADVGLATDQCCKKSPDGSLNGTIDFLAPSAAAWRDAGQHLTSLGLPKDENYQAKVLVSEYITVGHYVVQNSRPAGGWRYYSAPKWFVQGLQEYDGIFHTTESNRAVTGGALMNWAKSNASGFTCCGAGIQMADVYNGGATFMAFLADRFGEAIHARLLLDGSDTFDAALAKQTKMPVEELFQEFQKWLAAGELTVTPRPS